MSEEKTKKCKHCKMDIPKDAKYVHIVERNKKAEY